MATPRCRFTDPATGDYYDWQINYDTENQFGRTRSIEHTAPTSGLGLVRQQGDDPPMVVSVSGTIMHQAQHDAFVAYFALSGRQTIYFTDFTGDQYEVQITSFEPTRQRVVRNSRDPVNAPLWIWKYKLDMEVIRFVTASAWSVTLP